MKELSLGKKMKGKKGGLDQRKGIKQKEERWKKIGGGGEAEVIGTF